MTGCIQISLNPVNAVGCAKQDNGMTTRERKKVAYVEIFHRQHSYVIVAMNARHDELWRSSKLCRSKKAVADGIVKRLKNRGVEVFVYHD